MGDYYYVPFRSSSVVYCRPTKRLLKGSKPSKVSKITTVSNDCKAVKTVKQPETLSQAFARCQRNSVIAMAVSY